MGLKFQKRKISKRATLKPLDLYEEKQYTWNVRYGDDMNSELELLVIRDMIANGFDPKSKEDIQKYWKERLE